MFVLLLSVYAVILKQTSLQKFVLTHPLEWVD